MREFTLLGFISHLAVMDADIKFAEREAVERACKLIQRVAKDMIGTPQPMWPPLAESTLARKDANTPLLETGEMRDSIEYKIEKTEPSCIGHVGSDNMKAVWHELGTSKIPPRSFLVAAAVGRGEQIAELVGKIIFETMISGGVNHAALRHLLHSLKPLGQDLKDIFGPDDPDDDSKDYRH
jgi:hypothetical protein